MLFALLASALRLTVRSRLVCVSCLVAGCSLVAAAHPHPPFVSRSFRRRRSVLCAVCCAVLCIPGCGAAPRCGALCRWVLCRCVLCCFVALILVPLLIVPRPLMLPFALGFCALWRCVLPCSPVLCALCCVYFVVACSCALLFAAVGCAVCVLGCCAVRSLSSPLCAVLCFAVPVRLCCAVRVVRAIVDAWCCDALLCVALFLLEFCGLVLGLVARGCLLVVSFGVGVPVGPRGLLPCGWYGLLWCPASLCRVLLCCAVAWCCAVVLCCRVAVLLVLAFPSCCLSCCAVLCCLLVVLFFAWWWCLRAVVLSSACCAFPVFSALRVAVPCCARCGSLLPCVFFCGAVLSRGAVACRAVMCCAVGWLCFPLPAVGVCVLWCSFPPCRHAQRKTLIIALCYPAPVSVSVVHVVGEVCLVVRCVIADPGHVVFF